MFKITNLEMQKSDKGTSFFLSVDWECEPGDLVYFYHLNKFYKQPMVLEVEPEELEKHWDSLPPIDPEKEFTEQEDGSYLWTPTHKNAFELGLVSNRMCHGSDKIQVVEGEENTYRYQEWVVDSPATRALALQIARMQSALKAGEDPTYRSGSAISDFANLIQAIDIFWH